MATSPLGFGFIIWPVVGFLLAYRDSRIAAWLAGLLLGCAYLFTVWWWFYGADYPMDGILVVWRSGRGQIVAFAVWYLIGQITFWALILTVGRKKAKMGASTI
jgi:hypothetical protein